MLSNINPTTTKSWRKLAKQKKAIETTNIKTLFAEDPKRFDTFSVMFEDILLDYSKNIITQKTLNLLLELANECELKDAINRMYAGEAINETEGRSVLHIALRNRSNEAIEVKGENVMPYVNGVLAKMKSF